MKLQLNRITGFVVFLIIAFSLFPFLKSNLYHLNYLVPYKVAFLSLEKLPNDSCNEIWLSERSRQIAGEQIEEETWKAILDCGEKYLPLVQAVQPKNKILAEVATDLYPESEQSWLWLASLNDKDPAAASKYYQYATKNNPANAFAWCSLGKSLEKLNEVNQAVDAYINCCRLGDPGLHGCWGAGHMLEKIDNIPQAIHYYRLSRFSTALKRADDLEQAIK